MNDVNLPARRTCKQNRGWHLGRNPGNPAGHAVAAVRRPAQAVRKPPASGTPYQ